MNFRTPPPEKRGGPKKKLVKNVIEVLAGSRRADHFEYKNLKMNFRTPPLKKGGPKKKGPPLKNSDQADSFCNESEISC